MATRQKSEIELEMARNEGACEELVDVIQLISNKHRFRIICLLSRGDYSVSTIAEILHISKLSNLSQQLKILRLAGVISSRRDEKRIVYSLADERIGKLITLLRQNFIEDGKFRRRPPVTRLS